MARKRKPKQQAKDEASGSECGDPGPSEQKAQAADPPSKPTPSSGQVAPPADQGSQGGAPASQGGPWQGRGGARGGQGDQGGRGGRGGRGGAQGRGQGSSQSSQGGAPASQGVPWQSQGSQGGSEDAPGSQGGQWGGRGGGRGGQSGRGGRGAAQGGQGGPLQGQGGQGGQGGAPASQGVPWQSQGSQGGSGDAPGSQGGPWGGRGGRRGGRGGGVGQGAAPASQGAPVQGPPQTAYAPAEKGPMPAVGGAPPGDQQGPWQGRGGARGGRGGGFGRGAAPASQGAPVQGHDAPQTAYPPAGRVATPAVVGATPAIGGAPPGDQQGPRQDRGGPSGAQPLPSQQQTPQQKPAPQKQSAPQQKHAPPPTTQFASLSVSKTGAPAKQSIPSSLAQQLIASIPVRKDPMKAGTKGRRITVETNMMSIILNKDFRTHAIHYDVDINPDRPKFLMRTVFEALRKKEFPKRYPAFDGKKNAYSAGHLLNKDIIESEVEVFDEERQQMRTFKITLKKANELDLSWLQHVRPGLRETEREQTGIQVLDVILRQGPSMHSITLGRSFFHPPKERIPLSSGLDLWLGSFQSAVLGWKPYLNIDVAHKGCPTSQSVIDLIKELCQERGDRYPKEINCNDIQRNIDKIESYLKGLKVLYEIPNNAHSRRTHRVNSLAESPRTNRFTLNNGQQCTVLDYYIQEKGYRIKYPDIPCLWVGSRDKKIYVPPELCTIVAGQMTQKKMDEMQTSTMIKYAATSTKIRKEKIMHGFASLRINDHPTMKEEFRLAVEGKFEEVPARVLDPPDLLYHTPQGQRERSCRVSRGTWRAENFLRAANLPDNSWSILNLNERFIKDSNMYDLQSQLQNGARAVGMTVGVAHTPFVSMQPPSRDIRQIMNYFEDMKKLGLKLIIVIIPDRVDVYSKVKQITELKIGVLTQCLKTRTLQRMSPATVCNILLKINSKLNGTNHKIAPTTMPKCLKAPCMIVGADVTHPSPDARDIPSIAAVVASHDEHAFRYNIEVRLQPPKTEIIQDLTDIIVKQLKFFYNSTHCKPTRLIFFRDGVSEGQLPQVMHHEISAIKKAFRVLSPSGDFNPPITFLVVQKRHHIRLFPTSERNSDDRNFNVQAGTIVDTHITHPSHIDFYLVSHASIQGTARPTKYRCICNETDDTEDEIEQLTYYLCHMFSRCTRSVSYPAPTYYAHLACTRARALTYQVDINLDNLLEEQEKKLSLKINKDTPMFFV